MATATSRVSDAFHSNWPSFGQCSSWWSSLVGLLLVLLASSGNSLDLANRKNGSHGPDRAPSPLSWSSEGDSNNEELKFAPTFQATRANNSINLDRRIKALVEAASEPQTTIIMLAEVASTNSGGRLKRAPGKTLGSGVQSANPCRAGCAGASRSSGFRRSIDLPSRSAAPIEMTTSAAIRMKSNGFELLLSANSGGCGSNSNVESDRGQSSACVVMRRRASRRTTLSAVGTEETRRRQANEICAQLVCCICNVSGQVYGEEHERAGERPNRHVLRADALSSRCLNAATVAALEIGAPEARQLDSTHLATRWRSRCGSWPRPPRDNPSRTPPTPRQSAIELTQKQKHHQITRQQGPQFAHCRRLRCAKIARRRAKFSPVRSSLMRSSSAALRAQGVELKADLADALNEARCCERPPHQQRANHANEHSAIVLGRAPDHSEFFEAGLHRATSKTSAGESTRARATREARTTRPVAIKQQQRHQQQDFKPPSRVSAFNIQEDEQVQEQLLELLAEFYAHLRGTQRKLAIASRRLNYSNQHREQHLNELRMQMGADEMSLTRWLAESKQSDRFPLLHNVSLELVQERPNRTINVCPDGPKILVLPNVSDIIYCYTRDQWIEKLWSDSLRLSAFHYPIILLNILIFLVGTTGNIFVCLSVKRNHQLRSVTNYFIVNLAFADFLVILICLPATVVWDLSLTWFFDTIPCKLIMFLQDVSISVSVLTLTAISIDRYYAICHPLKFKTSLNQAKHMIVLIWMVSLVIMAPDLMYLSAKRSADLTEAGLDTVLYSDCNYNWSEDASRVFQFVKTVLLYLLPFILMFCAHYKILKVLRLASSIMSAGGEELNQAVVTAGSVAATGPLLSATVEMGVDEIGTGKQKSSSTGVVSKLAPSERSLGCKNITVPTCDARLETDIHSKGTHCDFKLSPGSRRNSSCRHDHNHHHYHHHHQRHHHHHDHHHLHQRGHKNNHLYNIHHHRHHNRCHKRTRHDHCKHQHQNHHNNPPGSLRRSDLKLVNESLKHSSQAHHQRQLFCSSRCRSHFEHHKPQTNLAPKSSASSSSGLSSSSSASNAFKPNPSGTQSKVVTANRFGPQNSRQVSFSDQKSANNELASPQQPLVTFSAAFRLPAIIKTARKRTMLVSASDKRNSKGYLRREKIIRSLLFERESSFDNQLELCQSPANASQVGGASETSEANGQKQLAESLSATVGPNLGMVRPDAGEGAQVDSATKRNHLRPLEGSTSSPGVTARAADVKVANASDNCAARRNTGHWASEASAAAARRLTRSRSASASQGHKQIQQNHCDTPNNDVAKQQQSQSIQSQPPSAFILTMHNKSKLESRRKAAKMLTAIVVLFGICYLPVHLINFLRQFIDDIPQTDVTSTISMLSHCVCYLNSAINPIIYNHMNSVFRAEFRKFLSCLDWLYQKPQQQQQQQQQQQKQKQEQLPSAQMRQQQQIPR